jgi:long-chain acyl-CoA synthetase
MTGPTAPSADCPVIDVTAQEPATGQREPVTALRELWGDPAGGFLMYTSGTTGQPKGVKRASPGAVGDALTSWAALGRSIGLGGEGSHLVCGPVYHAAPGLFAFYELLGGASLVIQQGFDSEAFCAAVEAHRISRTHLVPTMFVRLLRQRQEFKRDYNLHSLKLVLHGAAPVAPAVKHQMIQWWGDVIVEYWGGSESGIITRIDSRQWLAHEGSVGAPLPQFELSVRDEQFRDLPPGEVGTLWARHRQLPQPFSYYRDSGKTAAAYHGDWFTLGDLGYLDRDGFAYLADRRANLIISGGVNIYPAEVESALLEHADTLDVAVVGLDDEEWGKRVHALVQLRDGVAGSDGLREEILAQAGQKLARFKLPRSLEFVDELPRVDSGKLYRARLKT